MVTDEGMAVRFYRVGNARDLADQIIRILRSPELEHRMAEQNFTAGVQMTMTNVIRSYLRWFRLHQARERYQKTTRSTGCAFPGEMAISAGGDQGGRA